MDWLHVAAIDDGQVCQSSSDAQRAGAPLSHPPGCRPEGSRHSHGQLTPDGYSSLTVPAIKSISQIWRVGAAQPAAPASMRRGMRHEFAIFLHERVRVQVLRDDAARGAVRVRDGGKWCSPPCPVCWTRFAILGDYTYCIRTVPVNLVVLHCTVLYSSTPCMAGGARTQKRTGLYSFIHTASSVIWGSDTRDAVRPG